jgi:predicted dehydrogenase
VSVLQTAPLADAFSNPVNIPWRVQPDISGGGLFLDIGTHVLDTLMLFFGEYDGFSGKAINAGGYYRAEDTLCASFQFKNGIVGTGQWCFVAEETLNRVEIGGDRGSIIYDGMAADSFCIHSQGERKNVTFTPPEHIAMPYQQAIVNELRNKSTSFANFDHAVNLMQMIDPVLESYYGQIKNN